MVGRKDGCIRAYTVPHGTIRDHTHFLSLNLLVDPTYNKCRNGSPTNVDRVAFLDQNSLRSKLESSTKGLPRQTQQTQLYIALARLVIVKT